MSERNRHRIVVENGPTFDIDDPADSLLRGALRAGIAAPYECSVGGCGTCRFELLDGPMDTVWPEAPGLSERERKRGKRLACQSRAAGDCTIRMRLDDVAEPALPPRRMRAVLESRRDITPELAEFTLRTPCSADFRPGQYALLDLPGVTGARAYSMSNRPNTEGIWQFIVRNVAGGAGSRVLFDQWRAGDAVPLDGPYGHAYLRADTGRDIVCIAGGSGLAPMLSIARAATAANDGRLVRFFHGMRTQADLPAAMLVEALAGPNLELTRVLSLPDPDTAWAGARGNVHAVAAEALPSPLGRFDFYFAGPPPMVEAVQALLLMQHKVPHDQVHFDRFL